MAHSKLYRSFIILQEGERGHSVSKDKPLSGYAKVESKNDKCRISFYAQNLKSDYEKCNMMVICNRKDIKQNINIGEVNITSQGKVDFSVEFDSDNIGESGIDYEKLVGASLYKEIGGNPVFFMYGFLNGEQPKDNWKEYKTSNFNEKNNVKKTEEKKLEMKKIEHSKNEVHRNTNKHKDDELRKIDNIEKTKSDIESIKTEEKMETRFDEYESRIEEYKEEAQRAKKSEDSIKEQKNDNTDDYYKNDDSFELRGGMGEFFSSVVTGLQEIKGFASDIKNCKWFKIPVNDFEEMCNMSNYNKYTVAYYPMINYYPYISKYGYFMVGFKVDSNGEAKYVVYAIPGGKDKKEQPYCGRTGFVTWVPDDNSEMKGHWVMFYDFQNSMVVVPMK